MAKSAAEPGSPSTQVVLLSVMKHSQSQSFTLIFKFSQPSYHHPSPELVCSVLEPLSQLGPPIPPPLFSQTWLAESIGMFSFKTKGGQKQKYENNEPDWVGFDPQVCRTRQMDSQARDSFLYLLPVQEVICLSLDNSQTISSPSPPLEKGLNWTSSYFVTSNPCV